MPNNATGHRRKDALSETSKAFSSYRSILHLFGPSVTHQVDALLSQEWQEKHTRENLLKRVAKSLHPRVEELLEFAAQYRQKSKAALAEALLEANYFPPPETTVDAFVVEDINEGRVDAGASQLLINAIFCGEAGKRRWEMSDEPRWHQFLTGEMSYRAKWVTGDRHHRTGSKELRNIYFRLSPWVALAAIDRLDGPDGKLALYETAIKLAEEFQAEAEVDVVGVAVHSENSHDLHLHVIFSETREVPAPEKDIPRYILQSRSRVLAEKLRKEAEEQGKTLGKHSALKRAREMVAAEKSETYFERRRGRRRRPFRILGPSFRGKLQVWEASGRDQTIAAMGDRPVYEANTFRGVVCAPIERGEDIGKTFIDVWGERRFEELVQELFESPQRTLCKKAAEQCVKHYKELGTTWPALEDEIASKISDLKDTLKDQIPKDLDRKAEELAGREEKIKRREKELAGALIITDEVRKKYGFHRTTDAEAALQALVRKKERAEKRLQAAIKFVQEKLLEGAEKLGEAVWSLLKALLKILKPEEKDRVKDAPEKSEGAEKPDKTEKPAGDDTPN